MTLETHFFLDLEGTLIERWDRPDFLPNNAKCIRRAIQEQQPATLNIFSFMINDPEDRKAFRKDLLPGLERFFGMPFTLIPTVEDCQKAMGRINEKHQYARVMLKQDIGKWVTFQAMVLDKGSTALRAGRDSDVRCVLFDDDVMDLTTVERRRNIQVESIRIQNLVEDSKDWLREQEW